ncbi:MAG TPA: hypothetical protein VN612_15825 [Acidobacteriaceae bacterium]|nr:hypothetical protein [Acidobacteriaceae bacterium]
MQTRSILSPTNPLAWWTRRGKLALKADPSDSSPQPIQQDVSTLGTIAGRSVVQIITTRPTAAQPESPPQEKTLLVQVSGRQLFRELYRFDNRSGGWNPPFQPAGIYGSGSEAILATEDVVSRTQCAHGYWWFDSHGAHPVDFIPLLHAVSKVVPANGNYMPSNRNKVPCFAMRPQDNELRLLIQTKAPSCHACDFLGTLTAKYRIDHGRAIPVSVHFDPDEQP